MIRQIRFNLFQLMVFIVTINIILYGNLEKTMECIKSILDIHTPEFWFFWIHAMILYILLSYTKVELGSKCSIQFTL